MSCWIVVLTNSFWCRLASLRSSIGGHSTITGTLIDIGADSDPAPTTSVAVISNSPCESPSTKPSLSRSEFLGATTRIAASTWEPELSTALTENGTWEPKATTTLSALGTRRATRFSSWALIEPGRIPVAIRRQEAMGSRWIRFMGGR